MSLLNKLTKFYKDESVGLPHEKAEIWDIAWLLADIMENFPSNCKLPSLYDNLDAFVNELKTKPDIALIDIAVDALHQTLLAQSKDDYALLFHWMGEDIVQYLLTRNDDSAWKEAESWAETEDAKLAEIDALEEEFWREIDELEGY